MSENGRVALVTGAGSGVGAAAAVELARRGLEVVAVGRSRDKLQRTVDRIRDETGRAPASFTADFTELAQVRGLAGALTDRYRRIDVLANNAGFISTGGRVTTPDGHEAVMQVDHLAPFLLTYLLLGPLRTAAEEGGDARVIGTASAAEAFGALDPDDLGSDRSRMYRRMRTYGAAKKANVLFAAELSRRQDGSGIVATSFHPGIVRTDFGGRIAAAAGRLLPFAFVTPEQGADTLVHLATHSDGVEFPGGYFEGRRLRSPSASARDPELARRLWESTASAVGITPDW
jgi:NAD(P)-dependent dehydrogenase (short-subunit alcohol dehydrogenase family)